MEKQNKIMSFLLVSVFLLICIFVVLYFLIARNKNWTEKLFGNNTSKTASETESKTDLNISRNPDAPVTVNNVDLPKSVAITGGEQVPDQKVILSVGKESIYQADFVKELDSQYTPKENISEDTKVKILNKLIFDSVVLQYGFEKGILNSNDASYFNNFKKDYSDRITRVNLIKDKLKDTELKKIAGTVFTVFFYNVELGSLPYADAKKIAYQKTNEVYNSLKNSEIDVAKAIEILGNDPDLKKIDKARSTNIYFNFDSIGDSRISYDKEFDKQIKNTEKGQLTAIYTGKDFISDKNNPNAKPTEMDNVYMFAYISKKSDQGYNSLQEWFEKYTQNYNVKIY